MLAKWPPLDKREEKRNNQLKKKADELEKRRIRILQSKPRAIGLDVQALREQIEAKQRKLQEDHLEQKETEVLEEEVRQIMLKVAEAEDQDHKDVHRNLTKVWEQQKDRTDRPEFDINDPNQKKTERFDWEHCGPSSAQKFEGDITRDHVKAEIKRLQYEQDNMLRLQQRELSEKKALENYEEKQHALHWYNQYQLRKNLEEQEAQNRLNNNETYAQWNRDLHRQKEERDSQERKRKEEEAQREHQFILSSNWLREDRANAFANAGNRVIRSEWKGMTPSQIQQICREQKEQMNEAQRKRDFETQMESDYVAQQEALLQRANEIHKNEQEARQQERLRNLNTIFQQRKEYEQRKQLDNAKRQEHGFNNWWPFGKDGR